MFSDRTTAPSSKISVPFYVGDAQPQRATVERRRKEQQLEIKGNIQQVVGGLTLLSRSGEIDQAQSSAAERWYRDYVMGIIGARDPDQRSSGKAPDIHASMLARTAAVARCRAVREGLGLCSELRLKLFLVDELTFSAIAAKLLPADGNRRKKVAAQFSLLLEQLAELYERLDRLRR